MWRAMRRPVPRVFLPRCLASARCFFDPVFASLRPAWGEERESEREREREKREREKKEREKREREKKEREKRERGERAGSMGGCMGRNEVSECFLLRGCMNV